MFAYCVLEDSHGTKFRARVITSPEPLKHSDIAQIIGDLSYQPIASQNVKYMELTAIQGCNQDGIENDVCIANLDLNFDVEIAAMKPKFS